MHHLEGRKRGRKEGEMAMRTDDGSGKHQQPSMEKSKPGKSQMMGQTKRQNDDLIVKLMAI